MVPNDKKVFEDGGLDYGIISWEEVLKKCIKQLNWLGNSRAKQLKDVDDETSSASYRSNWETEKRLSILKDLSERYATSWRSEFHNNVSVKYELQGLAYNQMKAKLKHIRNWNEWFEWNIKIKIFN